MRQSLSHIQWWSGVRVALACAVSMASADGTGDLGGPRRLARWMEARKAERERVALLAAAGVRDASLYSEPGANARMTLRRSANALTPVVGVREQRRAAAMREASGRTRRSSTSDEEDSRPIMEAWRARQQQKRTRSLTSSGRTAAAVEDHVEDGREERACCAS